MHALTEHRLLARVARAQREGRLPALAVGVLHDGDLWTTGRGEVAGAPPTADTQFRIGSITKMLTAVLVLQLRDEGRLRLEDRVGDVADGALAERTIGELLGHTAGVGAETDGPWWERSPGRDWNALRPATSTALDAPQGPGTFHYSNLGYAALGQVVEAHRGAPWSDVLRERVLSPLGMDRTTVTATAPAADGFAVHPWADLVLPEPLPATRAMAPAGQLWSTVGDLARWARFLLGDSGGILDSATLAAMAVPRAVSAGIGGSAYGLGAMVDAEGGPPLVGHGGSMPGFRAGCWVDRLAGTAAIALANATTGLDAGLPRVLLAQLAADEPPIGGTWRPDEALPEEVLEVLGVWYQGPAALELRAIGGGGLRLQPLGDGAGGGRDGRLDPVGRDRWRGRDGYFAGEVLEVVRGPDSAITHLRLASFALTRAPYDPDDVIPGGVDPAGWRGRPGEPEP